MYTLNAPYKEKPFLHVGGVNWNVLNAEASATSEPAFFLSLRVPSHDNFALLLSDYIL